MSKIRFFFQENAKYLIFALSILVGILVLVQGYIRRNSAEEVITVTGLGTADFESDLIVWSGYYTRLDPDMKAAYAGLSADQEKIRGFLTQKNVADSEYTFSSVEIVKEYDSHTDKDGNYVSVFRGYRLEQRITIESREVEKIEKVSREITDLINTGVEFYSSAPQYYYTQLADMKIRLIEDATRNARERAAVIADMSGQKLGKLKNASMGVFQIIAQNSNEDYTWGGSFNTESKMKTATITMKLQFGIR
jgi:hypothetical protein